MQFRQNCTIDVQPVAAAHCEWMRQLVRSSTATLGACDLPVPEQRCFEHLRRCRFQLLPTAYGFATGHCVRVAFAGADAKHFSPDFEGSRTLWIHSGSIPVAIFCCILLLTLSDLLSLSCTSSLLRPPHRLRSVIWTTCKLCISPFGTRSTDSEMLAYDDDLRLLVVSVVISNKYFYF